MNQISKEEIIKSLQDVRTHVKNGGLKDTTIQLSKSAQFTYELGVLAITDMVLERIERGDYDYED